MTWALGEIPCAVITKAYGASIQEKPQSRGHFTPKKACRAETFTRDTTIDLEGRVVGVCR
jgi:hypothetical protein